MTRLSHLFLRPAAAGQRAACAGAALLAMATGAAQAQTAATPQPCTAPEFRQMDFWLGTWAVRWDASPGLPAGSGRNTITKTLGGCVVQEHFEGGPATGQLVGHSVSLYHQPAQRWRQTWVDNQGGYFALVGGSEGERFVLVSSRLKDGKPAQRMVFEAITAQSLVWRWQVTADEGASWTDRWVIHYARMAEAR